MHRQVDRVIVHDAYRREAERVGASARPAQYLAASDKRLDAGIDDALPRYEFADVGVARKAPGAEVLLGLGVEGEHIDAHPEPPGTRE